MTDVKFTAEDFSNDCHDGWIWKRQAAEQANAKLAKWLAEAPVVFGVEYSRGDKTIGYMWTELQGPAKQRARLVDIQPIKPEYGRSPEEA